MQSTSGSLAIFGGFCGFPENVSPQKALRSGVDGAVEGASTMFNVVWCAGVVRVSKRTRLGLLTKRLRQTCVAIVEGVRKPRSPQLLNSKDPKQSLS
jgi:hypothetical protein